MATSDNQTPENTNLKLTDRLPELKQLTLIIYILYAASVFAGITTLVAIILNYVKRPDTQGTIYASHFTWQIRTFWWGLLWAIIGGGTVIFGVGFIVLSIDAVWIIYRLIKGVIYWNEDRPMIN